MGPKTCTVTELNNYLKLVMDNDPRLKSVFVRGELSNYKIYPSGHHYFTLKDAGGALRCVMFQRDASRLRFRPENGMKVICTGRVSVFPRDGAYQLYAVSMEPEGLGDLYAAYEQLKVRLTAEGLFDPAHKKPLPEFPERIAVITSGAGAAVRDIIRILGARWPMAKVIVLPVRVQGAEAPPEIVGAIRYANRWNIGDVIITGRGGGSLEDLWAFNDERVVRAIYESEIPVISAVGHEPDVTLSDFVSDVRASTPSNAAELAVREQGEIRDDLFTARQRADQSVNKRLRLLRDRLTALSERGVLQSPLAPVRQKQQELDRLSEQLSAAGKHILNEKQRRFIQLSASMEAMSPLKVLTRGYSIVSTPAGKVITSSADTVVGELVHARLANGGIICRVEETEEAQ